MNRHTQNFNVISDPKMLCTCCRKGQLSVGILIFLEHLRAHFGKPVTILSGPRCANYNRKVGGSKRSEHLIVDGEDNDVADITVKDVTTAELYKHIKALPYANLLGIGYYPKQKFVHVDLRGFAARW